MTVLDLRGLPGAVFGSAVDRHAELTAEDAVIRAPLSTTRRIGFLSLAASGAVPALALQVTRLLAARRDRPVLAVDVSADGGFARLLEAAPTPPSETRAAARTTEEALTGLAERDGVVALHPPLEGGTVATWLEDAAPITRFFDVSVTDFGAHHPVADLGSCAALCDVVCVVSDAGRSPAEQARSVLPAIAALPEAPAAVLALVDASGDGAAVARALAATTPHPVVAIPADAAFRAGGPPRSLGARRALIRLAATLAHGGREVRG